MKVDGVCGVLQNPSFWEFSNMTNPDEIKVHDLKFVVVGVGSSYVVALHVWFSFGSMNSLEFWDSILKLTYAWVG